MPQPRLRDDQWEPIYAILRACPGIYVAQEPATRRFVEAVLWMARAGCAWRLVPQRLAAGTVCTGGSRAGRRKVSGRR